MLAKLIAAAVAGAESKLYVDDVFSTYVYTGNGSTQTITNGIDLAGKGGMVWIKERAGTGWNLLLDTARTISGGMLTSNATDAQNGVTNGVTSFNSNGFSLGADGTTGGMVNGNARSFVSWTFRKAPKFFDCGTFVGDGTTDFSKKISHTLGIRPGLVLVKNTSRASNWMVWHPIMDGSAYNLWLNSTNANQASNETNGRVYIESSGAYRIQVASAGTGDDANRNGDTYVWYAFAHDTGTDGIIQCGSFTTDGSGNATMNLGWEPQFAMVKRTNGASDWYNWDVMRGWGVAVTSTQCLSLFPNLSSAEVNQGNIYPTATGFGSTGALAASGTYVYLAIRRPNKPPTSGTQVYNAIARTGTGATATVTGVGFAPDLVITFERLQAAAIGSPWFDRLRGAKNHLLSAYTASESTNANTLTDFGVMDGFVLGSDINQVGVNYNGRTYINYSFRRAPGVFDMVCYTGTGVARTVNHNLGAVPELIVTKKRVGGSNTNWFTYSATLGAGKVLTLNETSASQNSSTTWNNTSPTISVFSLGADTNANENGSTYVAYLFATKAGISKVGSYTGNGSSQTINCGFSAGARFVLIKRTDSTGDWFVWDSARGIVAGNDPHLSLNTTAAEVTTDDSIDPDNTGFIVNQLAATNINVNAATYIFLALA